MNMLFVDFVEHLFVLEKTSSRLEITSLLCSLLKEMSVDEVGCGVYLTQGLIGPIYDNREFGMATKMVMRSVVLGVGIDKEKLDDLYRQSGDLGETVFGIHKSEGKASLSVVEVFEKLKNIAFTEGIGSQEMKVSLLSDILRMVTPLEAKYVVRIVLGRLRLGFSEKTVFDAVSQMEDGSKSLRKELDKVYQYYPDSGEIVKIYKKLGLSGLRRIHNKVGVPVVSALCQRLNTYEEIIKNMKVVSVEPKYDGTRVQIHYDRITNKLRTYTRNLEENSASFLELKDIGKFVGCQSVILDCEAVGVDTNGKILPFQVTITRKRKHGVEEASKSVPLHFFVFDILNLDGNSLLNYPYFERRKILEKVIIDDSVLSVDEYHKTDSVGEVEELHERFLKLGYEGAVLKRWDGEYLPGRQGWNWVKIKESEGTQGKLTDTFDLAVLGYYYGRGKRAAFGMGAFLVGTKRNDKWVSLAKIGTGLTDEEFKSLAVRLEGDMLKVQPEDYLVEKGLHPDVWVKPKVVVEVAADEITKSPNHSGGIALRFPRLVKFRDDKSVVDVTTWAEVLDIGKLKELDVV